METISNEQKAKDITKCLWFPQKCTEGDIQNMLMKMAEWKDEQYDEEKRDLLELVKMIKIDEQNQTIIEDLKAILQ